MNTFLPIIFTTLGGIGPPEAVHYLDALFSDSYASELAASGSTRNTAHARRLFYLSLLATLTKIIRRRLRMIWCSLKPLKIARAILSFLCCALAHSVLRFHTNKP